MGFDFLLRILINDFAFPSPIAAFHPIMHPTEGVSIKLTLGIDTLSRVNRRNCRRGRPLGMIVPVGFHIIGPVVFHGHLPRRRFRQDQSQITAIAGVIISPAILITIAATPTVVIALTVPGVILTRLGKEPFLGRDIACQRVTAVKAIALARGIQLIIPITRRTAPAGQVGIIAILLLGIHKSGH